MVDYSVPEYKRFRLSADKLNIGDIITVVQAMQVNEEELADFNLQLVMEAKRNEIKYVVCEFCPRQPCPGCMLFRGAIITRRQTTLANWRKASNCQPLELGEKCREASFGVIGENGHNEVVSEAVASTPSREVRSSFG